MRIYEFADAESQLALLRTIIDNTWTAIAQQAEQKKRSDAERKAQAKLKARTKKTSKGASVHIPAPPPLPAKKPQASLPQQPTSAQSKPTPNSASTIKPSLSSNPQLKPLPTVKAIQPKPTVAKPITPSAIPPKIRQNAPKTMVLGRNIGAVEKDDDTDDRHSKNGIAMPKKLPRNF